MTNNWEIRFSELQNHLEENREYPTKQENPVLYNWITDQRKRKSYMKSAEMKKLNSINFIWNAQEYKWNKKFCQLLEYSKTNEFELSVETNKKLYLWYREQKRAIKRGELRQDRTAKINSIIFSEPAHRWRWLLRYEKFRQWREANPGKWPRYNRNDSKSEESKLHVFSQTMRKCYRDNNLGEFWYNKLAEINFNFKGSADNWLKNYNKMKKLIEEHDSILTTVIGDAAYNWVLRHKKKLDEGTLTAERAALVRQLQLQRFFISWDSRFNMLKQWVEENGKLPSRNAHKENNSWLYSQRARYKKGNLSEERTEKLKSIGFNPESRGREHQEKKWLEKLNQYKSFLEDHGKEPSYFANDEDEKRLYLWIMAQRAVKAGTARNRNPLSKERTDKLNAVSFGWVGRGPGSVTWHERFEEFKKYIQADGSLVLRQNIDGKRNITYTWWAAQKRAFKKGKLSAERISKLKKAGDINLHTTSRWTKWVNRMKDIAAFIEKNGSYPKARNPYEEDKLYQSRLRIRRDYRAGQLSDKQLRLINELNMEL